MEITNCTAWSSTSARSRRHCLQKLKQVSKGLFGHQIKVFPRSNWCGADKTLDDIGLPTHLHGLMFFVFAIAEGFMTIEDLRTSDVGLPQPDSDDDGNEGADFQDFCPEDGLRDVSEAAREERRKARRKAYDFLRGERCAVQLSIMRQVV